VTLDVAGRGVAGSWAYYGADGVPVTLTPGLVITVAIIAVIVLVLAAVALWLVWRRLRRSTMVRQGLLQARAVASPSGPDRDLARLRLQLAQSLAQTHRVLVAVSGAGGAPPGLADITRRLDRAGAAVDAHLRLMEREPDPALLSRSIPGLRQRVQALSGNASRIREIALRFSDAVDAPGQDELDTDLREEISSLESGIAAVRQL
jgi:hypothetical protein